MKRIFMILAICILSAYLVVAADAQVNKVHVDPGSSTSKTRITGNIRPSNGGVTVKIEAGLTKKGAGEDGEEVRLDETETLDSDYKYDEDYTDRIAELKAAGISARPFIRVTVMKDGKPTRETHTKRGDAPKKTGKLDILEFRPILYHPENMSMNEDLEFHITRELVYDVTYVYSDPAVFAGLSISILFQNENGNIRRNFYKESPTDVPGPVSIVMDTLTPLKPSSNFMEFNNEWDRDEIYIDIPNQVMNDYCGQIETQYPNIGNLNEDCYLIVFEVHHVGGEWVEPEPNVPPAPVPGGMMDSEIPGGFIQGPGSGNSGDLFQDEDWRSITNGVIPDKW